MIKNFPIKNKYIEDENMMESFFAEFSERIQKDDCIAFFGEMGSGKTFSIKVICNYFNVIDMVNSPTFNIVNYYSADCSIIHIDLFRINSYHDLLSIDWDIIINSKSLKLIEWSEKADTYLPLPRWEILLEHVSPLGRKVSIQRINKI